MKEKIEYWFMGISMGIILVCVAAVLLKLTYDFYTAPNVFMKEKVVVEQTQKQIDDMCVKWWFDSDLTAAKKRVCGK